MHAYGSKFVLAVGLAAIVAAGAGGCSAPSATLELITVARKGLALAQQTQAAQHAEILSALQSRAEGLDAAFDADVRLAAAGQIEDQSGQSVEMTAEWVISARRGYTAARDILGQQIQSAAEAAAVQSDNIKAADEALEMASQLIVQQYSISERLRRQLIDVQRSLIHGK